MKKSTYTYILFSGFLSIILIGSSVYAQVDEEKVDDLKKSIDDRTSKIRALEKEIEKYEEELVFYSFCRYM